LKRQFILLAAIFMVALAVSTQFALPQSATHVTSDSAGTFAINLNDDGDGKNEETVITGGGTGTFNADLDNDEDQDTDGSYFWMEVAFSKDGSAQGHFMCLMAGPFDFLDLPLMLVEGPVDGGEVSSDESIVFSGVGNVNLGNGESFSDVPFEVTVKPGGPGGGSITLTVFGVFDGVPGDTKVDNNNYDLPAEMVSGGRIEVRHQGRSDEN
jgi:hypothetical protein